MYKNAFTCGIPNSPEVGNVFAAALGLVAGRWEKGLEALAEVTEADNAAAAKLVEEGRIRVILSGITSEIFIEVTVTTPQDRCTVTIRGSHTNIVRIQRNGEILFEAQPEAEAAAGQEAAVIHRYTLAQLADYARTVPAEEIGFIRQAYTVNFALLEEGLSSDRTTFAPMLKARNGGQVISGNIPETAQLLCNGAIEARVIGLDKPAMSITGSGAHGIIATMPLYAEYKIRDLPEEQLLRATALSYLVCMYIKEHSGRLSAFCGCAIAAGTGMACGLVLLRGGTAEDMDRVIRNMASSITGMICDGGNQGCTMKGIIAVDAAFRSVELAMAGVCVDAVHGINDRRPEKTMEYMGRIASPGMTGTEKTIVEIFEEKLAGK
jgi:L-cysteine desulfidase